MPVLAAAVAAGGGGAAAAAVGSRTVSSSSNSSNKQFVPCVSACVCTWLMFALIVRACVALLGIQATFAKNSW